MNCKLGDMAIIVKSAANNHGKIVTCVEFIGENHKLCDRELNLAKGMAWRIDRKLKGWRGDIGDIVLDEQLRPIRPSDEQDEMLRIAGLPNKEKERA